MMYFKNCTVSVKSCSVWFSCSVVCPLYLSWSLLKLMSIKLVMPSNHLILCCPLLPLPLIFLSIMVFSKESVLHLRWPKNWGLSFGISPSNEYSGLTSFTIDWFDLLAVQGTFCLFILFMGFSREEY